MPADTDQPTLAVTSEPLPCPNPWCSSHTDVVARREAYAPYVKGYTGSYSRVVCAVCPLVGPMGVDDAAAIAAWNTRTNSEPRPAGDLREAATAAVAGAADYVVRFEAALAQQKDDPSASLTYLASQAEVAVRYIKRLIATHSPAPMAGKVERPSDEALEPHLPESLRAEKRIGIRRSDWLTGWFLPWSPRNDNQNAEGPWSHWVLLANAILAADAKAQSALAAHPSTQEGGDRG